jgi:hypothetical protein
LQHACAPSWITCYRATATTAVTVAATTAAAASTTAAAAGALVYYSQKRLLHVIELESRPLGSDFASSMDLSSSENKVKPPLHGIAVAAAARFRKVK